MSIELITFLLTVTFLTKPAEKTTLINFFRLVKPSGPGWKPIQAEAGVGASPDSMPNALLGWAIGITFVYSGLFGAGSYIYGKIPLGIVWTGLFILSSWGLIKLLPRLWSKEKKASGDTS